MRISNFNHEKLEKRVEELEQIISAFAIAVLKTQKTDSVNGED